MVLVITLVNNMFNLLKPLKYTVNLCIFAISCSSFTLAFAQDVQTKQMHTNTSSNIDTKSMVTVSSNMKNGQHHALACLSCHSSPTMPNLHGMPKPILQQKMNDYAKDIKTDTIMHQLLKGYSDADIEAVADYFSSSNFNKANGDK
jgi:cytochrome c553